MRTLHTVLAGILAACTMTFVGCESTPQTSIGADGTSTSLASDEPIESGSISMIVHGMGCPLCANNVDKQLLTVPGVDRVNVDMGSGRVTVQFGDHPRPSRRQLARAIDDSGFTLMRFESP